MKSRIKISSLVFAVTLGCMSFGSHAYTVIWDLIPANNESGGTGSIGHSENFISDVNNIFLPATAFAQSGADSLSNASIQQYNDGLGNRRGNNNLSNTESNAPNYEFLSFQVPTGIVFNMVSLVRFGSSEQAYIGGSLTETITDFSSLIPLVGGNVVVSGSNMFNLAPADYNYLIVGVGTDLADSRFRVSQVKGTPEPATLALMGLGIAGLGTLRHRKAKA